MSRGVYKCHVYSLHPLRRLYQRVPKASLLIAAFGIVRLMGSGAIAALTPSINRAFDAALDAAKPLRPLPPVFLRRSLSLFFPHPPPPRQQKHLVPGASALSYPFGAVVREVWYVVSGIHVIHRHTHTRARARSARLRKQAEYDARAPRGRVLPGRSGAGGARSKQPPPGGD